MALYVDRFNGHPREPETFEFTQSRIGKDGWRVRHRSYVEFDSRDPWWKNAARRMATWLIKRTD